MSNYVESKRKLDAIRNRVGEPLFRMALTHTFDVGFRHLTEENIKATCEDVMKDDDSNAFMTNEYKCDLVRTAGEIANVPLYDVEVYVHREMEYSAGDDYIQYNRLLKILKNALDYIYEDIQDCELFCKIMDEDLSIDEDEIIELGYDWAMNKEDESYD